MCSSDHKKQAEKLQWTLDRMRELYNAALQERRDAYEMTVKRHPNLYDEDTRKQLTRTHAISYEQQADQLPAIKELREDYTLIHSQVLQETLHRVKKAFDGFFRRVKEGKTAGYPRFKGKDHFDSFCYPQSGFSLTQDHRICLSKQSIRDSGWAQFVQHCENKAEEAGSRVLFVDPKYTSQRCSVCGTIKKKTLDERWHSCPCGAELDRDHNSARDILRLGLSGQTIQKKAPRPRRTYKKQAQARTEPSGDALLRSPRR